MSNISRRGFLTATGSLAMSLGGGNAIAALTEASRSESPNKLPHDVGRKFQQDGVVLPFYGNTFIGHLEQQGNGFEVFNTLLNVYRAVAKYTFKNKIALTPPSSYHITVFGGLNAEDRGKARWPNSIAANMTLNEVTKKYLIDFQKLDKKYSTTYEFAMGRVPPVKSEGTLHIPLMPANRESENLLYELRNVLSKMTGIREADHDTYHFHITLGYLYKYLTVDEAHEMQALTKLTMENLAKLGKKIQIPTVQFCQLSDMYAFEVLHKL